MKLAGMKRVLLAVIGFAVSQLSGYAEIVMPPVLSSHMVLQRNIPVPVWGTALPGEKITVEFAGQKKEAVADDKGKWKVILDPLHTSEEPKVMVVSGASGKKELEDILVGEIWVGSGQSNMQMGGGSYTANDEVLAKMISGGPYPQLRIISSGAKGWMESTPENLKGFSALLFSFGLPLHKELNVPVGLLAGAVGGTPSGFWLSQQAYESDQACKDVVAKAMEKYDSSAIVKKYEASLEKWKKDVEEAKQKGEKNLPREPQKPQKPGECKGKVGNLYERHILPYIPFAIRGVLWDQGESGTAIEGVDQYTLMGALIRGWRKEWGQPSSSVSGMPKDIAFLYVQKPSGGGCAWDPADPVTAKAEKLSPLPGVVPGDGEYTETHIRIRNYPDTFMVISSDLGQGIHPVNKSGYGARGARVALGAVYGKNVEIYGPVYKSHKVEGTKVIISYDHIGKGLAVKKEESPAGVNGPGKLQGFAVAGEDGKFVWADALIEGDKVVVSSDKVARPVALRYAWAGKHQWANLFNKDGLPAIPFSIDKL